MSLRKILSPTIQLDDGAEFIDVERSSSVMGEEYGWEVLDEDIALRRYN